MARQEIPLGSSPDGEGGDSAREAFTRVNQMTAELYEGMANLESGKVGTSDARLSDSREWTAVTVPQPEAEAGTSTTRRAWTAQRVWQAATAWWAASAMKTKLDGIEAAAQANPAAASQAEAEAGTGTVIRSWTSQRVWQAIAAWWNASAMKSKLDGIAVNATANATDGQLRDRSTHTGTQLANTISNFGTAAIGTLLSGFAVATSRTPVSAADSVLIAFQKVQKYLNDLGTAAFANLNTMPFINLMPDSGRFGGRINPLQPGVTTFAASTFLSPYNGGSHASGGQFFSDNSTNGGAGGALTEPVQALMTAMGRSGSGARYGIEFFVDTYTFGSGTANPAVGSDSVTRYLSTTNLTRALFQAQQYATMVMWIRARTSSFHLQYDCFKNGVLVAAGTPITVAEGWVHLRLVTQSGTGYSNSWPNLCGVPGSSVNIACMAVFGGIVDVGFHTSPLATINELSA
ncbi:hypothetical protein [Pseudomonas sp. PDM13]|uniref:hypothetical protein n=1 Tax=Pseudomonas sp. PDM13 TaxID=2769255 RepID=UPI0021E07348|nr:hypothetical protein [Pseudomonas sp. PDM13]MCU9949867.1 hypothetical protein [Pseudomonas sp. PDM13]